MLTALPSSDTEVQALTSRQLVLLPTISVGGGISGSTLLGGSSNDTFNLEGAGVSVLASLPGAGNDKVTFSNGDYIKDASIVGGAGDDSVFFAHTVTGTDFASNTYFFGANGGEDTLSFTALAGTGSLNGFTVAVDSSYGATSGFTWAASNSKVSFGSTDASENFLIVAGVTGSGTGSIGTLGITFTTVSSSVITNLG